MGRKGKERCQAIIRNTPWTIVNIMDTILWDLWKRHCITPADLSNSPPSHWESGNRESHGDDGCYKSIRYSQAHRVAIPQKNDRFSCRFVLFWDIWTRTRRLHCQRGIPSLRKTERHARNPIIYWMRKRCTGDPCLNGTVARSGCPECAMHSEKGAWQVYLLIRGTSHQCFLSYTPL